MLRFLRKLTSLSIKSQVCSLLYGSYIWDAVRNHYIETSNQQYDDYCNGAIATIPEERATEEPRLKDYRPRKSLPALSSRGSTSSGSLKAIDWSERTRNRNPSIDSEFNCPLKQMPRWLRIYQIISTVFICQATVKYFVLSCIHYGWIEVDRIYECYIPGRIGVRPEVVFEVPWMTFWTSASHVVFRYIWYFRATRLDLDCLLFLIYDRDSIATKPSKLAELNDLQRCPRAAFEDYLCDQLFFDQYVDCTGRASYSLKQHRTVEHYDKLCKFVRLVRIFDTLTFFVFYAPIGVYVAYNLFAQELFDAKYSQCLSFWRNHPANDIDTSWNLEEKFRFAYWAFDLFDFPIFFLDGVIGQFIPFSTATVLAQDLYLRFESLCQRISRLNDRLQSAASEGYQVGHGNYVQKLKYDALSISFEAKSTIEEVLCANRADKLSNSLKSLSRRLFSLSHKLKQIENCQDEGNTTKSYQPEVMESLEDEFEQIIRNGVTIFEQTKNSDQFISRLSMFSLCIWFIFNLSAQFLILVKPQNSMQRPSIIIYIFLQMYMIVLFTIAYIGMSHSYKQTRQLYNRICSAMALTPTISKTKTKWLQLLEYYDRDKSRYTMHIIGHSYALTNLNLLRCVSWSVTVATIVLSLWGSLTN